MTDQTDNDDTRTVEIPERTAEAISARLDGTEFGSIDAYVTFALEQLLRELDRTPVEEAPVDPDTNGDSPSESGVESRLESLGYL